MYLATYSYESQGTTQDSRDSSNMTQDTMKSIGKKVGSIESFHKGIAVKLSIVLLFISLTAGEADAVDTTLDDSHSTRFVPGSGAFFRVHGACPFLPLPDGIPCTARLVKSGFLFTLLIALTNCCNLLFI